MGRHKPLYRGTCSDLPRAEDSTRGLTDLGMRTTVPVSAGRRQELNGDTSRTWLNAWHVEGGQQITALIFMNLTK